MIGIGFDIHRLVNGRKFILGGITISYSKGLLGHSDADVLLHALIDALLGAAKMGDIGVLFPDIDPKHKDTDSLVLLAKAVKYIRLRHKRFKVKEVDAIVFLEEPKLGKLKPIIAQNIAKLLGITKDKVNVKAKTMEGLGPIGSKKAVASLVLVNA